MRIKWRSGVSMEDREGLYYVIDKILLQAPFHEETKMSRDWERYVLLRCMHGVWLIITHG